MQEIDIAKENAEILAKYRKLLKLAKPLLKDNDAKIIKKAFNTSAEAHKNMRRKSGEPYIFHPLAVAQIVVEEIGLGTTSIVAALLHDVVEDTDLEIEDIRREFGPKVAEIIDGLTKISGVFEHGSSQQAENFRKMLLTLSDDVRVILIKLADRLHNMRTMDSMPRDKQLKIASETIYMYAPLAHRLGLHSIKTELEDLYLSVNDPQVYRSINQKIKKTKVARDKFIKDLIAPLEAELAKTGLEFTIKGRMKSLYSIWKKMSTQNISFEEVYDLFAIRIIVNTPFENEKSACWQTYSIVTDFYKPNPDRLRDWISTPRSNGYESLHCTVMSPSGQWVEVQIRTKRMDDIAEKGYAAHWKYKEQEGVAVNTESGLEQWLYKVRESLEKSESNAFEFLEEFRSNLFKDEVYVFTPKGDIKTLPHGAGVLDFAFDIHSQIGRNCIGAKVNHKIVPLSYELKNGDQIEVLTSSKQLPVEEWLKYVVTSKAIGKIKDFLRREKMREIEKGRVALEEFLLTLHLTLDKNTGNYLIKYFDLPSSADLYLKFIRNTITSAEIQNFKVNYLDRLHESEHQVITDAKVFREELKKIRGANFDTLMLGENMDKIDYSLASCCKPIPGDDVFGFVTVNEGIKIHRTICPNAIELMSNYGTRIIKSKWTSQAQLTFLAGIKIEGADRFGILSEIVHLVSNDLKINIRSVKLDTEDGAFSGLIVIYIHDTNELEQLLSSLKAISGVYKVNRFDSFDN